MNTIIRNLCSHALLAVGYSDQSNSFIVRNSWGKYWVGENNYGFFLKYMNFLQGDNGYCYIPYEYMTNPNFCFDVWTIRQLASDDFGQEHWDNDDSINYYQTDEDPDDNEENGRAIKQYDNDDDLIQDTKTFAEQMLGSFISLAL
jgi:hypothetical protein